MSYHVAKHGDCPAGTPHGVIDDTTGKPVSCHASHQAAHDTMQSLPELTEVIPGVGTIPATARAAADAPEEAPAGPVLPALATVPQVDIVAAGQWNLSTGPATFTKADLAAAVEASRCPAVGAPVIKLGHVDTRFDGEPAVGRVQGMALSTQGNKITADLAGLPGWLPAVLPSAYPSRSIEGSWDVKCSIGHVHPFVISALALLGVVAPGVGVLGSINDVAELYGMAPAPAVAAAAWKLTLGGAPMNGVAMAAGVTTEDVRRAYYEQHTTPYSYWITEMQVDPPQLIVCDDAQAKVYRVPVTITDGAVTFGAAQEVVVEYMDVASEAAAAARAALAHGGAGRVAFASAAASRAGVAAAWSGPAAVKNLGDDPSTSALKKLFALPGDTKSDSKLPHHDVSADGTVGAANVDGCTAAIGALNGGRGGVAGLSADDKSAAYSHLAAHIKAAGGDPPELKAAGPEHQDPEPPADPDAAAAAHGPYNGTHSHAHPANGSQGDDMTHTHEHSHSGDAVHTHDHAPAAAAAKPPTTTEGAPTVDFTEDQLAAMRTRLGIKDGEELTAEQIAAAFVPPASGEDPLAIPEGAGVVMVDASILTGLQERAARGEDASKQLRNRQRDDVLGSAIRDGKFPRARLEHYQRMWSSDPEGTRRTVDALAKGLVPVDGPLGHHGVDPDMPGTFEEQQAYGSLYPEDIAAAKAARDRGAVTRG